jgi:hypothetical protein
VRAAERHDRGAELDVPGALGGGGQYCDRQGDAELEMAVADPGAVEAEVLAQLDDLQGRLMAGAGVGLVEQADGEEAEFPERSWHSAIVVLSD